MTAMTERSIPAVPATDHLTRLAQKYAAAHREQSSCWSNGRAKYYWFDDDGNMCIEYESGAWWHYRVDKQTGLRWW